VAEERDEALQKAIEEAEAALAADDDRTARDLVEKVAEIAPNHPRVHSMWEEVVELRQYKQGISAADRQRFDILRGLLENWPSSVRGDKRYAELEGRVTGWIDKHREEAEEHQRNKRWNDAKESWNEVLNADPDNEEAQTRSHDCMVESIGEEARKLMSAGAWDNAIAKWEELLRELPESDEARHDRDEAVRQRHVEHRRKLYTRLAGIGAILLVALALAVFIYIPEQKGIDAAQRNIVTALDAIDDAQRDLSATLDAGALSDATAKIDSLVNATSENLLLRVTNTDANVVQWRERIMLAEKKEIEAAAADTTVIPAEPTPEEIIEKALE
jgi:tetratricopeptide (TPR) repeat protein